MKESWLRQEGKEFWWGKRFLGILNIEKKQLITWRKQKHFFIKYQGWGFNRELINKLISLNIQEIILIYRNSNNTETLFRITPKEVRERGIKIKESYFEDQLIVEVKYFRRD